MKQLTVAYQDLQMIDNHECLLPSVQLENPKTGEKIHCVIHRDPMCTMQGSEVKTNYDFLVSFNPATGMVRNITLPRKSKKDQAVYLAEKARTLQRFPNFYPIKSWASTADLNNDCSTFHLPKVLIKYQNGARGICQLLVNNVARVNKATLLKKFWKVLESFLLTDFDQTSENLTAKQVNEKFNAHLAEHFPYDCAWSGIEQKDLPQMRWFLTSTEYIVQEFVDNIREEYRGLTGVKGELHIFQRGVRAGRPFAQATGTNGSVYVEVIPNISDPLQLEIADFLSNVIPEMNSSDLVLFDTPDGVKYGIFEFCCQFGTDVDDPAIFRQMHTNFLTYHARIHRPDLFE